MSTPISNPARFALLAALLLPACHGPSTHQAEQQTVDSSDPNRVECAPAGAEGFQRVCTVDRVQSAKGLVLTLSAPDGAFRRLLVTGDGRGLISADGAEPAIVRVVGPSLVEVTVGADRYRLPAHLKGKPPASGA